MEKLLEKIKGTGNINTEGQVERIVSIPIYEDDDYTSIMYRFIEEFGDEGIEEALISYKLSK